MTSSTTQALIGGVEPSLCRVLSHLAEKYGKLFLPWSCLEIPKLSKISKNVDEEEREELRVEEKLKEEEMRMEENQEEKEGEKSNATSLKEKSPVGVTAEGVDDRQVPDVTPRVKEGDALPTSGSHVAMVTPTGRQIARAVCKTLSHMGWRHISIITIESRYWRGLAHLVDEELRTWQRLVPALFVLPPTPTQSNITALFEGRTKSIIKAYILVLPTSSSLIGRVLEVAEMEGVTRLSAFFVVDPLYAPTPIDVDSVSESLSSSPPGPHPSEATFRQNSSLAISQQNTLPPSRQNSPSPSRQNSSRRRSPESANGTKRFQSLRQFVNISVEAARSVMILAPITRGPAPPPIETKAPTEARPLESEGAKERGQGDQQTMRNNSSIHKKGRVHKSGKKKADSSRSVMDSPLSMALSLNQSAMSETDWVLTRLVFDSVSLLSHILRANVGAFRLRRKSTGPRNSTSEDLRPPTPAHNGSTTSRIQQRKKRRRKRKSSSSSSGGTYVRSSPKSAANRKQPGSVSSSSEWSEVFSHVISEGDFGGSSESGVDRLIRDLKSDLRLAEDVAERERLYFEMKKLNTEREGREFERRLESIIGSSRLKENGFNRQHKKEGGLSKSQAIEMKVKRPTFFPALRGQGFISTLGERHYDFVLLDWDPKSQEMTSVLELIELPTNPTKIGFGDLVVRVTGAVDWAHNIRIPRDKDCGPTMCGYAPGVVLAPGHVIMIVVCLLFVFAACFAAAAVLRKRLRQKEMSRGPYKILLTSADLTLTSRPETAPRKPGAGTAERPDLLRGSFSSPQRANHESLLTTLPNAGHKDPEDAKAKYNGDFVHLRYFYNQGNFEVKNKSMTLLKQMHDLRHENVNGFLGMLCDPIRPGFVFEFCSRRSLEDVIRQEDIKLDWSFRLSLLTDLVRGMRYLHGSPLRHHGRLTSRNCVIDARWVLKVTDYGLPGVYDIQNISQPSRGHRGFDDALGRHYIDIMTHKVRHPIKVMTHMCVIRLFFVPHHVYMYVMEYKDLLWKAPEQLRDEGLLLKGSQPTDVFSFSIIMQEVVVRGSPYCMVQLTHQEIIARLKKPPPMIRPSVSKGAAPPDAINIMKQCWAELPEMRPDFNQIYDLFKKLNQGRRLNIVDTMFQMLEKYSSNLEELIRDRTEQLDLEKKKTEQLLNRMLPSSVANQLKLGMPVAPEEFDEVTIYFSDIVGFTSISAYSTPFEVVDLLNDLYTAFDSTINHYNVYKVETIGDAYMVVGGVPKRIEDHAAQIATMALDLLHLSGKFKIRHLPNIPLMLRIGMHTGPCCAGVVGMTMPRYCLFGDTVNTASRMESTGSAWRIHVSEKTSAVLREAGGYHLEYRGLTKLKGKGEMPTYWLLGKEGFMKDLPVPPEIGLDEELIRLGRQHYMNRRDSTVESLTGIKGFSSIHAAKMQTDPQEACSSVMAEAERASCSSVTDVRPKLPTVQQTSSESEEGVQLNHDPEKNDACNSDVTVPNGRTRNEISNVVIKENNRAKGSESSSTKSASKSNCVRSKNVNAVPKGEVCDSSVVPKAHSRDRSLRHTRSAPRSSLHSSVQNHVSQGPVIELQNRTVISRTPISCPDTPRNRPVPTSTHRVVSKSHSSGGRCQFSQEELEELALRGSSCSPGPIRGSSPPHLCHNKIYPQKEGLGSPVRDNNRPVTNSADSWRCQSGQQDAGAGLNRRPSSLRGVTAECEVHPRNNDPPSPTESTML